MKFFYKIVFILIVNFLLISSCYGDDFVIIPEGNNSTSEVQGVFGGNGTSNSTVWDRYNQKANKLSLGDQMSTGIMNWNTILNYITYLYKFLYQLSFVIGALMLIYAGYLYASNVFLGGNNVSKGSTAIRNAILGVFLAIFSFAIINILLKMFW